MFRQDFPLIAASENIFFDSASSAQKPAYVIQALRNFFEHSYANIHRGAYDLSLEASDMYEHSKRRVARVLGLKRSYEVVYTYNATYAFNLLARNLIKTGMLTRGDVVLLGGAEHHANIVPWQILSEEYGIQIAWVALHADGTLDYDDMRSRLPKARVLSISGASNVTGEVLQFDVVQDMLDNCSNRPLWIVDGSQLFPHKTVDMVRYGIDIFVATGHKIMSDTGIGFFAANKALLQRLVPAFCGGGAINSVSHDGYEPAGLPFRHEPGTPHIAGAVSLGAALEYIESVGGHEAIWQYEQDLIRHFLSYIPTLPQGVRLIGSPTVENRLGVFSFALERGHPHDTAEMLADHGIAVRSGHHCAEPLHRSLGIGASLRASLYLYNTHEEIEKFFRIFHTLIS